MRNVDVFPVVDRLDSQSTRIGSIETHWVRTSAIKIDQDVPYSESELESLEVDLGSDCQMAHLAVNFSLGVIICVVFLFCFPLANSGYLFCSCFSTRGRSGTG